MGHRAEDEAGVDDGIVRELVAVYEATFRADDVEAWGRLFTEDADFVTHTGRWWRSRDENIAGHADVPAHVAAQKPRYRLVLAGSTALGPDVALVHARWDWPGFVEVPGGEPEDRSGIVTMVLVSQGDRWLVRASQNTRVA